MDGHRIDGYHDGTDGSHIHVSTVVLSEEMAGPRTEHKLPLDDDGSYEDAIRLCILSSPRKALTFDQLIEAMEGRWEFYANVTGWEGKQWKQAVYRDLTESTSSFELDVEGSSTSSYERPWRVRRS